MTLAGRVPPGTSPPNPTRTPAACDDSDAIEDGQLATWDLVVGGDKTVLRVAGELDMSNSGALAAVSASGARPRAVRASAWCSTSPR